MKKPTTLIDKNWLQRICTRHEITDHTLGLLKEKSQPVAASVLIEEVLANRFQPDEDQGVVGRMIQAILGFYPWWMEHPAELAFRELVKNERIANAILPQDKAKRLHAGLSNPEMATPPLGEWMADRYAEKSPRLSGRKSQQKEFLEFAPVTLLHPVDLATFAHNGRLFLEMVLNNPTLKSRLLEGYLGQTWKRWHPIEAPEIESAFTRLNYELLLNLPFTHSYLLLELLYDIGPITKVGPPESEKSNPQVLSGNQFNNEEDQEYVASALHCDRLLTCDKRVHRMADVFREAGHWKGESILIPREEADQIHRFLH